MKFRIVKIPSQPLYEELSIDKPCPFCGEERSQNYITLSDKGLSRTKKTWYTGIFKIKKHSVERNTCHTCESIWELNRKTEPFNLNDLKEK